MRTSSLRGRAPAPGPEARPARALARLGAIPALRVAAFLVAALAAAPSRAGIDVQVEGNQRFRSRMLKEAVPPDPEKLEDEEELAAWKEDALFNVEDLYRRSGYFEARVEVDLKPGGKPDQWSALVRVQEGPRYAFDTVRVLVRADTLGAAALATRASGGDSTAGAALATLDSADARRDSARAALDSLRRAADPRQAAAAAALARDTARHIPPEALGLPIGPGDLDAER